MAAITFTAAQIRRAEAILLDDETVPDQLMQSAAHAVFQVADVMLGRQFPQPPEHIEERVLLLAGAGGNGGDALYAGAELALAGHVVDAVLVAGEAQERALTAFTNAGGKVLDALPESYWSHRLIVDGMTGLGPSGRGASAGLRESLADAVDYCQSVRRNGGRVLAVDVPSGVDAGTGEAGKLHVTADVTVTFGGWRRAHALAPECGLQLCADIGMPGRPLRELLVDTLPEWAYDGPPLVIGSRAVQPIGVSGAITWPEDIVTLPSEPGLDITPGASDDKYTGGVVGIYAGSENYPGAAILSTAGAVYATPAMVRYAGPQALEVVRAHPEVVVKQKLQEAGRVQAWVFGPGAGEDSVEELRWVLAQEVPVLIDATGLTLLATHAELRELVSKRTETTVLTPHDGEFARLREAAGVEAGSRWQETQALAVELGCTIVRKGRVTVIAHEHPLEAVRAVDAGHSWAATPGSGDVLAGVCGAYLALAAAQGIEVEYVLEDAVIVHARAAKLAAETPYGDATAPASRIARFVRDAASRPGVV